MPAFNPFPRTIPTGHVTGTVAMAATRAQLAPTFPSNWVNAVKVKLFSTTAFTLASEDTNAAEIDIPANTWVEFELVAANTLLWYRQTAGSGGILNYWFFGVTSVGNV